MALKFKNNIEIDKMLKLKIYLWFCSYKYNKIDLSQWSQYFCRLAICSGFNSCLLQN